MQMRFAARLPQTFYHANEVCRNYLLHPQSLRQCCRKPHLHGKSWRQSHLHGKGLMKRVCRKLTAMFAANLPQYSPESLYFDKDVLHVLQFRALVYSINLLLLFYFLYYYYYIFFSVFTFFIQFITKQYIHITVIYSKHRNLSLTSV